MFRALMDLHLGAAKDGIVRTVILFIHSEHPASLPGSRLSFKPNLSMQDKLQNAFYFLSNSRRSIKDMSPLTSLFTSDQAWASH